MKNLLVCLLAILVFIGCGSDTAEAPNATPAAEKKVNEAPKKKLDPPAADYTGDWNYKVLDTPDGDYTGTMKIQKDGDGFTGVLESEGGNIKMEDIEISGNNMKYKINFQGAYPKISGTFTDNMFNGTVSVQGIELEMQAIRK